MIYPHSPIHLLCIDVSSNVSDLCEIVEGYSMHYKCRGLYETLTKISPVLLVLLIGHRGLEQISLVIWLYIITLVRHLLVLISPPQPPSKDSSKDSKHNNRYDDSKNDWQFIVWNYTFCYSLGENTQSFPWNSDQKIHSLARKYEHLRINQIQLRFLHFNQHSITLLGIHMRHSAYKREKYTFIKANIKVSNTILKVNRDNWDTLKCKHYSLTFL